MGQEYSKNVNILSNVPANSEPWLFDDAEGLLIWSKVDSVNATAAVTQDTAVAYEGLKSIKLATGATAPQANDYVTAERNAALGSSRYVEFIAFFRPGQSASTEKITFNINLATGGQSYNYGIQIDRTSDRVKYRASELVYTNVQNVAVAVPGLTFNYLRIVIDKDNFKYVSVQINDRYFSLANILGYNDGTSDAGRVTLDITDLTTAATAKVLNLDNVMVRGRDNI